MSITKKAINKAIKNKTGLDGQIFVGDGVAYFYSDIDESLNSKLLDNQDNCVYVCYLKHQTINEWVEDFISILGSNND